MTSNLQQLLFLYTTFCQLTDSCWSFEWFVIFLSLTFKPIASAAYLVHLFMVFLPTGTLSYHLSVSFFQYGFGFKNNRGEVIFSPRFDIISWERRTGQVCLSLLETNHLLLVQLLEPPWNVLQNNGLYSMRFVGEPSLFFSILNLNYLSVISPGVFTHTRQSLFYEKFVEKIIIAFFIWTEILQVCGTNIINNEKLQYQINKPLSDLKCYLGNRISKT